MTSEKATEQWGSNGDTRSREGVFVLHELKSGAASRWLLGIEHDGRLVTWQVGRGMPARHTEPRFIERDEDLPLEAADYEGPNPDSSTDVDSIVIADRGTHEVVEWTDGRIRIRLFGASVHGEFTIDAAGGRQYELRSAGDPATPRRSVDEPGRHALAIDEPPTDGVDWSYEPHWPGRRAWYVVRGGQTVVRDGSGEDLSGLVPELMRQDDAVAAEQLVVDGVVTVFDAARHPDMAALHKRLDGAETDDPVVFVAFDLLHLDGLALRENPLWHRRDLLKQLGPGGRHWLTSPYWEDTARSSALTAVRDLGMDQLVAKRRGSPYGAGGPTDWWRIIRS